MMWDQRYDRIKAQPKLFPRKIRQNQQEGNRKKTGERREAMGIRKRDRKRHQATGGFPSSIEVVSAWGGFPPFRILRPVL